MNNSDLHDDDFMEQAHKTQRRFAVIGILFWIFAFLLIATTVYFFLAAAGVVPEANVIPVIPYV